MDISHVDTEYLDYFSMSYMAAYHKFGVEPQNATAEQQKKIRKWLDKRYIDGESFPEDIQKCISQQVSDAAFIEFLKACHDRTERIETEAKQRFDAFAADLSKEVRSALWDLISCTAYCNAFSRCGEDVVLPVEDCATYRRTLILKNATGLPEEKADCLSFQPTSFTKQDGTYCLVGEAEEYEKDTQTLFAVRFTDAVVKVELFRADAQTFAGNPWNHLSFLAYEILQKHDLPGKFLNEKETALLPLLSEIARLWVLWVDTTVAFCSSGFPLLKERAKKFGYTALYSQFEALENVYENEKKRDKYIEKLVAKLNENGFEPLWRELYGEITASQVTYPTRASAGYSAEKLEALRADIEKKMHAYGYTGSYPDFVKKGQMRGIHLAESYDMTYFVGMEKNVAYHIHCTEEYFNEHLMIEFLCGAALLRKNESAEDIYACLFNAKGRRLFQTVTCEFEYVNEAGEIQSDDLEQRVQIAVKKAEQKKLTKEERKAYIGFDVPWWPVFLAVFIVMGFLFAAFMTLGFILMAVLAGCIIEPSAILSVLTDIPWWACFLLAWVLFGGVMGIITVLAKRK